MTYTLLPVSMDNSPALTNAIALESSTCEGGGRRQAITRKATCPFECWFKHESSVARRGGKKQPGKLLQASRPEVTAE